MNLIHKTALLFYLSLCGHGLFAQKIMKGKIIDSISGEPVAGASIRCIEDGCFVGGTSNSLGEFEIRVNACKKFIVSSIGYAAQEISSSVPNQSIYLHTASSQLQELVFTASRGEAIKRSAAPVAIASISSKMIQETRPTSVDQLLNKVSGVNMVNLGNEQHQMSIRQPMTTKSLFLYLEDGIPIRTSGLYNHNALLEMNMAVTKSIEVIKGPFSSLYGSEAIGGVVNFITASPSAVPVLRASMQGNNIGYKRTDLLTSVSKGKWGFLLGGYYADKKNGPMDYTDFHKGIITAKIDYRFSDKTILSNKFSYLNYYSDMAGGIDSTMFASKVFSNLQTFTYRKVNAKRFQSTLSHTWNINSKTTFNFLYRDNAISQNPAYRIKDDYRKVGNSYVGKKNIAHGEINENAFQSYSFTTQHRQKFTWKDATVIAGLSADISPSTYGADYIRINKDTVSKKYVAYQATDSTLTDYATRLNNYAGYVNFEFSPIKKLRVVASLRYDYFRYGFDNHLKPSAFSGSPDTVSNFRRVSPKIGLTYNFSSRTGIYANYSEGFVPPQVTELYTGVKVPRLEPSIFYNYEVGGWIELLRNKLFVDLSAYQLKGTNEIISVKLDDGSFANQNAGETMHRGIELGVNAKPNKQISVRISGAYSKHEFLTYVEKGSKYDGNEMSNAPNWLYNAEAWYRPAFIKGLRLGAELQHVGRYYVDPRNTATYSGYSVLNLRAGYEWKGFDIWLNVLNATDHYYSYITSKSASGYSYQLADPRNINVGIAYDFGKLIKRKS